MHDKFLTKSALKTQKITQKIVGKQNFTIMKKEESYCI